MKNLLDRAAPTALSTMLGTLCLALAMGGASPARAESTAGLCEELGRSALDCSCVSRRFERYREALPAGTDAAFLEEGYRAALGMPHRQGEALADLFADPQRAIAVEMALDSLGGMPGGVEDYEKGCVVAGVPAATLPALPQEPAIEGYIKGCTASTGDSRYCSCSVARARGRVNRDQFEAYYRSFADFSDSNARSQEEMAAARARAMGLTTERYKELQNSARQAIDPYQEQDLAYCSALLWSDGEEGDSAAVVDARYRGTVAAPAGNDAGTAAETSGTRSVVSRESRYPEAQAIVAQACRAAGNSDDSCGCLLQAVESEVFARASGESTALAYALINYGEGMNPMEMMQKLTALSSEDQMAAAMLSSQTDPSAACD